MHVDKVSLPTLTFKFEVNILEFHCVCNYSMTGELPIVIFSFSTKTIRTSNCSQIMNVLDLHFQGQTPAELIDSTPGYSLFSAPRSYTGNPSKPIHAGGTAFLIKEHLIQNSAAHHYSSLEYSSITIKFLKAQLTVNIYRPPPPSSYSQPFSTFLNQFSSFLSHAATTPHEFIITGDFNIHVDDLGDNQTILSQKCSVVSLPATVWNAPISPHTLFFSLKLLRSATNRYHKFIAAAKKSFNASLVQSS